MADNSAGRPRTVGDADIRQAVAEIAAEERVATTADVEERIDLSRRGLQKRLRDLHERGEIASKEVGARGRVWWIPEDAED